MSTARPNSTLTSDDIRHACGEVGEHTVQAILAVHGDRAALNEALAWLEGDDEHTPDRYLAPGSAASRIYELLVADEEYGDQDRRD